LSKEAEMSQREVKSFDPRWVVAGLAGAVAIVAVIYATDALDGVDFAPQVVNQVDSTPFSNSLSNGPVAGMPRSLFESLTATRVAESGLDHGPVPGMPKSLFEDLTSDESSTAPISGMPQGTFEQLQSILGE
jgi:hypothetical protein